MVKSPPGVTPELRERAVRAYEAGEEESLLRGYVGRRVVVYTTESMIENLYDKE